VILLWGVLRRQSGAKPQPAGRSSRIVRLRLLLSVRLPGRIGSGRRARGRRRMLHADSQSEVDGRWLQPQLVHLGGL